MEVTHTQINKSEMKMDNWLLGWYVMEIIFLCQGYDDDLTCSRSYFPFFLESKHKKYALQIASEKMKYI